MTGLERLRRVLSRVRDQRPQDPADLDALELALAQVKRGVTLDKALGRTRSGPGRPPKPRESTADLESVMCVLELIREGASQEQAAVDVAGESGAATLLRKYRKYRVIAEWMLDDEKVPSMPRHPDDPSATEDFI